MNDRSEPPRPPCSRQITQRPPPPPRHPPPSARAWAQHCVYVSATEDVCVDCAEPAWSADCPFFDGPALAVAIATCGVPCEPVSGAVYTYDVATEE